MVYGVGKQFHLSSLIIVLIFGVFLANAHQITAPWFRKHFLYADFHRDLEQFHVLARETAFLIRTFFFVLFGFSVVVAHLLNADAALLALGLLVVMYTLRTGLLVALRTEVRPLVFVSPRGLISILLFLSLPATLQLPQVSEVLLFLVVLGSCLVMALGLLGTRGGKPDPTVASTADGVGVI
jgi:hypothetical protein